MPDFSKSENESKDECQNGHTFEFVTFMILLHNVTFFGVDNTKKCDIIQNIKKKSQVQRCDHFDNHFLTHVYEL